jgi:hypothetical protein
MAEIGEIISQISDPDLDALVMWVLRQRIAPGLSNPMYQMAQSADPRAVAQRDDRRVADLKQKDVQQAFSQFKTRQQKLEFVSPSISGMDDTTLQQVAPSLAPRLAQFRQFSQRSNWLKGATGIEPEMPSFDAPKPSTYQPTAADLDPWESQSSLARPGAMGNMQGRRFQVPAGMGNQEAMAYALDKLNEAIASGDEAAIDIWSGMYDHYGSMYAVDLRNTGGGGGSYSGWREQLDENRRQFDITMQMKRDEERRAIMQAKAQIAMQAAGLMGDQYGNALRTQAQLAPYSLLPNQKYYMGYEPGGVAQSLYSMAGLPYAPRQAVGIPVDTMQGVNAMQGVVGQLQGLINGLG